MRGWGNEAGWRKRWCGIGTTTVGGTYWGLSVERAREMCVYLDLVV